MQKRVEMGTADMNKKIIKTASVIAVGAGAAALYKAKAAKDNNSGNETQGYGNSKRRNNKCQMQLNNIYLIRVLRITGMQNAWKPIRIMFTFYFSTILLIPLLILCLY